MAQTRLLFERGSKWLLVFCAVILTGCRSRLIDVTIANHGPALHVMEFDYPNASFGANALATGAAFQYRVQVQGSGTVSLQYEDAAGHSHKATGPQVNVGDQGSLRVNVDQAGAVTWNASLTKPK